MSSWGGVVDGIYQPPRMEHAIIKKLVASVGEGVRLIWRLDGLGIALVVVDIEDLRRCACLDNLKCIGVAFPRMCPKGLADCR
jgi:hypothetical protein